MRLKHLFNQLPVRSPTARFGGKEPLSSFQQVNKLWKTPWWGPAPESVLGKRTRRADDPTDGNDTEPDNGSPSTTQLQSLPSISNVAAMASRYALRKKLRPEQREEVDAFLLVSTSLTYLLCLWLNIGQDTVLGRQAKLFACILSLENKVDAFKSAAPPFQLSDELKVCKAICPQCLTAKLLYIID